MLSQIDSFSSNCAKTDCDSSNAMVCVVKHLLSTVCQAEEKKDANGDQA